MADKTTRATDRLLVPMPAANQVPPTHRQIALNSMMLAQHGDGFQLHVLLQILKAPGPEKRDSRTLLVLTQLFRGPPVLVKDKQVRIAIAHVQVIIDAAGLLARLVDETMEQLKKFVPLFRLRMKTGNDGALRFHSLSKDDYHYH